MEKSAEQKLPSKESFSTSDRKSENLENIIDNLNRISGKGKSEELIE